jgi:hypothetical protein
MRRKVSSAYLSAVEVGKRRIPETWVNQISVMYALDHAKRQELEEAFLESKEAINKVMIDPVCGLCAKKNSCKVKVKYLLTLEQIIAIAEDGDSAIKIEISCEAFMPRQARNALLGGDL